MNGKLLLQALVKYVSGVILMAVLLFVPAGTWQWKQAWILMGVLFVPMLAAGIVMFFFAPGLLARRLNMNEREDEQKTVILFSGLMFTAAFVSAGICFRYNILQLPMPATYIASAVFLCGYILFAFVLKQNEYLSRSVEVQEGQKVIDTGLYGIVRHPMYSATLLLFLSMPLILGSVISFIIMLGYLPLIQKRMDNEEKVLKEGLQGYTEYCTKVRYRIIPYLW
jgi:protein-S-isoprenylcysteine O-methyltransferase Ste14